MIRDIFMRWNCRLSWIKADLWPLRHTGDGQIGAAAVEKISPKVMNILVTLRTGDSIIERLKRQTVFFNGPILYNLHDRNRL